MFNANGHTASRAVGPTRAATTGATAGLVLCVLSNIDFVLIVTDGQGRDA